MPSARHADQHRPHDLALDPIGERVVISDARRERAHAAGVGPSSPSKSRLWSCADPQATNALAVGDDEDTRFSGRPGTPRAPPVRRPRRTRASTIAARPPPRPRRASGAIETPLPPARPSALTTTGAPSSPRADGGERVVSDRRSAPAPSARRARSMKPSRTPCSSRAAPRPRRTEERTPGRQEEVGDARGEGRFRPDDRQVGVPRTGQGEDGAEDRSRRRGTTGSSRPMPGLPGAHRTVRRRARAPRRPGERVLARAAAEDQDFHGISAVFSTTYRQAPGPAISPGGEEMCVIA